MALGILSDSTIPMPILLDAVRHSETGHLTPSQAAIARSSAGAIGPYQFLERYLPEFGYGMPADIPVADVQDPVKARQLANQYIQGYSIHHGFTTPLQKLVAYNRGPSFAAQWVARGENIDELPTETKQYITRAAKYLSNNQPQQQQPNTQQEPDQMANTTTTFAGLPFDPRGVRDLQEMARNGNYMARQALKLVKQEEEEEQQQPTAPMTVVPMMSMDVEANPNVNIQGEVINPALAVEEQVRGVLEQNRMRELAGQYPRSSYMAPQAPSSASEVGEDSLLYQLGRGAAPNEQPQAPRFVGPYLSASMPAPVLQQQQQQQGSASASSSAAAANSGNNTPPALSVASNAPALFAGVQNPASRNRRDSSAMSLVAPKSSNISDLMIAMGSAGMTASAQGGLEALGAMGKAYGDYQAAQQSAVDKYNQAVAKMAGKNKGGKGGGSAMSGVVVNDALNRIDPLLSGWSTGFGSYLNMIPGSDAQKVKNLLATVKGNIGFDKLQAMRDASPTGGALGQVSERELSFLQSVFGSLEQDQSAEDLRYNLELLRYVYNSIIHGEGNHPYQMPSRSGGGSPASSGGNMSAADAIVGIN